MGWFGKFEEVVVLVVYLCLEEVGFVMGFNIVINGG